MVTLHDDLVSLHGAMMSLHCDLVRLYGAMLYHDDASILFAAALEAELSYLYRYLRRQYIKILHLQAPLQILSLYLQLRLRQDNRTCTGI